MEKEYSEILCVVNNEEDKNFFWRLDDKEFITFKVLCQETDLLNLLLPYLKNKRTMIQAGGNCGMQVEKFAKHFDTVYTFEPDPVNFHCLVNNLPYRNVIKLQACLGNKRSSVLLNLDPNDIGGHCVGKESGAIDLDLSSTNLGGKVINNASGFVPLLMIDDFNLPNCDLIQLDIEGSELNALYGCNETIKKYKPVIVLELFEPWLNRYGHTPSLVHSYMQDLGYTLVGTYTTDYIFVHKENL